MNDIHEEAAQDHDVATAALRGIIPGAGFSH